MKRVTYQTYLLMGVVATALASACKKGEKAPGVNEDSTAPTVTVALADGQETVPPDGKIVLEASATDDTGVEKVVFYQEQNKLTELSTPPYRYEWVLDNDERTVGNIVQLSATVHDAAGNTGESDVLAVPVSVRIEMESGDIVAELPGEKKEDEYASGGQRVRGFDWAGSGIDIPVTIPVAGEYVLAVAGATGFDGNNGAVITIDGLAATRKTVLFENQGWNTWTIQTVVFSLEAGDHTINFRKESDETTGWADYDYFDIYKKP